MTRLHCTLGHFLFVIFLTPLWFTRREPTCEQERWARASSSPSCAGRSPTWRAHSLEPSWSTSSSAHCLSLGGWSYQKAGSSASLLSAHLFPPEIKINTRPIVLEGCKSVTRFFASLSLTFLSWYLSFRGFQVSPDRYSIHVCKNKGQHFIQEETKVNMEITWTVSGWLVSLICFSASSRRTSPQGSEFFSIILRPSRFFRRMPALLQPRMKIFVELIST